jgi:H+/Cl- antiporter ClcA
MGRGDLLPPMFLKIFSSACAVIVVACFAALFVYPIYGAWHEHPPVYNEPVSYVASTMAVLVGGIVAAAFGVQLPQRISRARGTTVKSAVAVLTVIYVIVYVLFGVAALITWTVNTNTTPTFVKNLGTSFLALLIPIVGTFFHPELSHFVTRVLASDAGTIAEKEYSNPVK